MKANLAESEPRILARWEQQDIYRHIRDVRRGAPLFVLHDGPPYANGATHLGHALNKLVKDFVVKSKTMAGFDSPYVPGWDCHGLPIEIKVDKELGARKAGMSAEAIRKACREYAGHFVDLHRRDFKRLGIFGRWNEPYLTMTPQYESVIAEQILKFIHTGYAYKGLRAVYWCIHDHTALADAEIEYANDETPSIWVKYRYASGAMPAGVTEAGPLYAVIWTTTPWTLPASMALAFHPKLDYIAAKTDRGESYILAESLAPATAAQCGFNITAVLARFSGSAMEGVKFRHPWLERIVPGVLADYVTTEQGTGVVHTAPGHGTEDFATGERYGLAPVSPVDAAGVFVGPESHPFEGQQVFAANPRIVEFLREKGALLAAERVTHSYPHCWRCHNPVIYRATEQWFIGMDKHRLRERALEQIRQVKWMPTWGEERITSMVSNRPDWCISRQRVWGVPIPVLSCRQCRHYLRDPEVDRRIIEVFARYGSDSWFTRPVTDFVPAGTKCKNCAGSEFVQERDIVDVWFESGSSQAAVLGHSPELPWPADMYLEGGDQYRGWFQSSLLVAVGTRGQAPYREVLSHGWTLDEQGRAMSKSLGIGVDPHDVISKYGAEVLRLWVASVDYQQDVTLSDEILVRLAEAYRKIRNTFRYLLGNLFDFEPAAHEIAPERLWGLDRYMLQQTAKLARECEAWYADYAFHKTYHRLYEFCAVELSAFYLDVLKDRLYTSATNSEGRRSAQTVLWYIAETLVRLFAPLLSFMAEEVWGYLPTTTIGDVPRGESVHSERFVNTDAWRKATAGDEARWPRLLAVRDEVLKALEAARRDKRIGTSLEARVSLAASPEDYRLLSVYGPHLPALFIVSQVELEAARDGTTAVRVERAAGQKCERCWNYSVHVGESAEMPSLCERCRAALEQMAVGGRA